MIEFVCQYFVFLFRSALRCPQRACRRSTMPLSLLLCADCACRKQRIRDRAQLSPSSWGRMTSVAFRPDSSLFRARLWRTDLSCRHFSFVMRIFGRGWMCSRYTIRPKGSVLLQSKQSLLHSRRPRSTAPSSQRASIVSWWEHKRNIVIFNFITLRSVGRCFPVRQQRLITLYSRGSVARYDTGCIVVKFGRRLKCWIEME